MNQQWLKTFLTLVEEGHFTRTASRLHMTQPGVTQHLQKLEQQLGKALISRQGRQFELTDAGRLLYQFGQEQHEREQQLLRQLATDDPCQGHCRVGCSGAVASWLYPRFLDHQSTCPLLSLSLEAAPNQRILDLLLAGDIDLGVTSQPDVPSRLQAERIGQQPLCLVLPASWQSRVPDLDELNTLGFIDHPDGAHYVEQLLQDNIGGFAGYDALVKRGYINQLHQILLPVSRGLGFSALPGLALQGAIPSSGVCVAELPEARLEPLYLVSRRSSELPARYQWFREQLADLAGTPV